MDSSLVDRADDECAILISALAHIWNATFTSSEPLPRCVPEIRQSPSAISVVCKLGTSLINTVADAP